MADKFLSEVNQLCERLSMLRFDCAQGKGASGSPPLDNKAMQA